MAVSAPPGDWSTTLGQHGASHALHPSYFLEYIVIKVECQLFQVPHYIFDASDVFRGMFRLPQCEGSLEGRHKDHPVILEGYLADDFTQLVRVLLPKDTIPLSPLNWVSVLKLSTVWNFEDVRRKAIDSLAGFALDDPIARFLLLSQYNVEEWRIPTLNALARRTKPLDEYDSIRLQELYTTQGVLTFIMCVAEVRETFKPTRVAKMIAKPCIPLNEAHDCAVHSRPAKVDMCQSAFEEYHSGPMTTRAEHDFTEDICRVFGLPKAEHGPGHFPSTSCRGSGDSDCDETWLGWIWLCVTFAILLHGACLTLRSQPSSCHSIVESACKIQGFAY